MIKALRDELVSIVVFFFRNDDWKQTMQDLARVVFSSKLYWQDILKLNIQDNYYTHNLKLACFVCYLKITNIYLKNNICILKYSKLSKELKNGIEILVGQTVFKLQIKTVIILFLINTKRTTWST